MKRIILLLLVLTCFRFSYGEELTAEQQQLAWKFIYDNMLNHMNLSNVFHTDIRINLEGKVTHEDSIIVENIILDIKKAIPHLKIEITNNEGNFILWINRAPGNYNSKMKNFSEITLVRIYLQIPESYSIEQRKKFIYYRLLREGLVFYKKPLDIDPGMRGCVFSDTNFEAITFSPFDLFILEKIYSPDFPIQLARNLSPDLQQTVWNSIQDKFLLVTKEPIIYRTDIAIKLIGNVSPVDSICMNELIAQLKMIIPNRKIFLTKEKANLIYNFLEPVSGVVVGSSVKRMGSSIQLKIISSSFSPNISKDDRKRTLYFNLMRSLVNFSPSNQGSTEFAGCVFDEKKAESITYNPVDAFILNKLYSDDFSDQFKSYWIKKWSARSYYSFMYFIQLRTAGIITGILLAVLLFSVLVRKDIFKFHNWKLNRFIVQILWIIATFDVYQISNLIIRNLSFQFFLFESDLFRSFAYINLALLLVPMLFFLSERKLITLNVAVKNKLLLLIANSILISFSLALAYHIAFNKNDISVKLVISFGVSIVFASIRFLLFTFSELKKNELKEKDNELILLREKNKQAELQSLRAKINPHFLYNALNSIASLANTDARKTEQMALALSDFFKYAINREQKQLNTLSEELNATRTYLEIEKVRFGDRLSFEIDCPEELLNIQIPQLLIQPLVENAIKHGLSQITENGLIRISVSKVELQLKIRVYDNGPAFPDGPLTGFGIQNTQERIALLYGEKASVNWENGANKYIEISIPI